MYFKASYYSCCALQEPVKSPDNADLAAPWEHIWDWDCSLAQHYHSHKGVLVPGYRQCLWWKRHKTCFFCLSSNPTEWSRASGKAIMAGYVGSSTVWQRLLKLWYLKTVWLCSRRLGPPTTTIGATITHGLQVLCNSFPRRFPSFEIPWLTKHCRPCLRFSSWLKESRRLPGGLVASFAVFAAFPRVSPLTT